MTSEHARPKGDHGAHGSPGPLTLDAFLQGDEHNLQQIRVGLPYFRELMPHVHALYSRSLDLIHGNSDNILFAESLLMCHKAFLCAAATIGRCHPDDAASITRRAIETALLAIAVKADRENFKQWEAFEVRSRRWEDRHAGKKPASFSPKITYPDHPLVERLRHQFGVLSDAFVHYTPEFAAGQDWRKVKRGQGGYLELPYLTTDQRAIEQQLILLGGIHVNILDGFAECCFDFLFAKDREWAVLRKDVQLRAEALARLYESTWSDATPDPSEMGGHGDGPTR